MLRLFPTVAVAVAIALLRRIKRTISPRQQQLVGRQCRYEPVATDMLSDAVVSYTRQSAIMTALCLAAWRPYRMLAAHWLAKGRSERAFVCAAGIVVHGLVYWSMNAFFLVCDRRRWLEKYKLERTEAMGPSDQLIHSAVKEAAFGQFISGPPVFWFVVYPLATASGMPAITSQLPTINGVFTSFMGSLLVNDFFFYWAHRLFHDRRLYSWVHKQHHEFKGTVGFASEHASPAEQIFANQLPATACFLFGGQHLLIFLTYLLCRLEGVYEGHSGYCFYGTWLHKFGFTRANAAAYHDFHHTKNTGNFGAPWFDYFFGTMEAWQQVGGYEGYISQKREGVVGNVLNNIHPSRVGQKHDDKKN